MRTLWACVCLALVAGTGCQRKKPAEQAPPGAAQVENAPAPAEQPTAPAPNMPVAVQPAKPLPPPPPSVAARAENYLRENVPGDPDAFLSAELRNFVQLKHRMPESFAEFANVRLDSIPRPPEGKKWVIDMTSLQVKSVPAK